MKRLIAFLLISEIVCAPFSVSAYDLSQSVAPKKTSKPVTLALIPFAEKITPELQTIMKQIERELYKTKGIRLLDREKTDSVLQYYLTYVNKATGTDTVATSIQNARQVLLSGNNDGALKILTQAEKQINENSSRGGTNEGLHQIYILSAKIYHNKGDQKAVDREYDKLVLIAPDFQMDKSIFANWEKQSLNDAKSRIAPHLTASIKAVSNPEGAEVFLNGIHAGITPMELGKLPAGAHTIELKTVNHASSLHHVRLAEGEHTTLNASLVRTEVPSGKTGNSGTIRPSLYRSPVELSKMISTLGYHLGVDKVVLVADKKEEGNNSVIYQLGDTKLGAIQKENEVSIASDRPMDGIAALASFLSIEAKTDILSNPAKYTDQTVGNVALLEKRKKPLYKKPLFWVLLGLGAATGGVLGVVLGSSSAAVATTGGAAATF